MNKMKTVFINGNKAAVNNVFPQKVQKELMGERVEIFSKAEVLENPRKFACTEYIFSTWGMPWFSEEEIKKCFPSLKCVFYAAGTVQHFARPFLNCGVKIFSAWAANAVPVAEYTVAQIILANKGFYRSCLMSNKSEYSAAKKIFSGYIGNYGAKIGIIGAGMIGKLVIEMLKSYNLEVLVFDPFLPDSRAEELGVEKCSLEKIFAECNVISNHLANNEQTKGMLCGKLFEAMLPNATFLNTGRGAQVVESELCKVLSNRPDIVAVLDVTEPEPPEDSHPFYTLENCILTPHIAGSAGNEVHRMAEYMLAEYNKFINGEKTDYEVTIKMLETMA